MRRLLEKIARQLPARDIRHNGRPYLRRYYLGTIFGVRFYLHHFVDSDPDGLHNHPWRYGGSVVLAGHYYEERRFCMGNNARRIRWINWVHGDTLHRVVIPEHLKATVHAPFLGEFVPAYAVMFPRKGTWSLFWHTKLVQTWNTFKDKGAFVQVVEHHPNHERENGHSTWWRTAPKGKELFG